MADACAKILAAVKARDPAQPEFHQAATEVIETLKPVLERHPEYIPVAEAIVEPECEAADREADREGRAARRQGLGARAARLPRPARAALRHAHARAVRGAV